MLKPNNLKPNTKALDDIASLAGGAVNVLSSVRAQIKNEIKARVDDTIDRLDLVPREDFDRLQARVDALSAQLEELQPKKKTKKS